MDDHRTTAWTLSVSGSTLALTTGLFVLSLCASTWATITVSVDTNDLPVGAATTLQLFLQPGAGPLAGVGATLYYDPSELEVPFAGMDSGSMGGPDQAYHLLSHTPGKVVLGAARPQGTTHTPAAPEPLALLQVQRLEGSPTTIQVTNAFVATAGAGSFVPLTVSDVVFGFISDDSDGDGIPDAWEYLFFGDLATAGLGTDYDGDGVPDVEESAAGTNPRIPYLTTVPGLLGVEPAGDGLVQLTFPTEASVQYRLERATSLLYPDWSGIAFARAVEGTLDAAVVVGDGNRQTVYVEPAGIDLGFFRLVVTDYVGPDLDADGMDDAWEYLYFANLSRAGSGTDFDKDGVSDRAEHDGGTNPLIPYLASQPHVVAVGWAHPQRMVLSFPTEASVQYRLQRTVSLPGGKWTNVPFSKTDGGPLETVVLIGSGSTERLYVDMSADDLAFYRLVVFAYEGNDTDGDGIGDVWEYLFFGNLATAGEGTDFDGDGDTDQAEYDEGTHPRIPYLSTDPSVAGVARQGALRVCLTFTTDAMVPYHLQATASLETPDWTDAPFALTSTGAVVATQLVGTGGLHRIFFDTGPGSSFFRLVVNEP